MDDANQLRERVKLLFNKREYQKVIELIESVLIRDYELTKLLAKAYLNRADETENATYYQHAAELLLERNDEGNGDAEWNAMIGVAFYYQHKELEAIPFLQTACDRIAAEGLLENSKEESVENIIDILNACFRMRDFMQHPEEQPLNYYESRSYMYIMLRPEQEQIIHSQTEWIERIRQTQDVELLTVYSDLIESDDDCHMHIRYKDDIYEVSICSAFVGSNLKRMLPRHYFSPEEKEMISQTRIGLLVMLRFEASYQNSFHLQLKLMDALVPDILAVVDESAQQIFSGKWIHQAACMQTTPSPKMLYTIQAVGSEDDVWLHTHGLARCGKPELELLHGEMKYGNDYADVINAVAGLVLDSTDDIECGEPLLTAFLGNEYKLMTTLISWPEAIERYPTDSLGGISDRKYSHNTHSCAIFVYENEQACDERDYAPLPSYSDCLGDDAVYVVTTQETERMRALAQETVWAMKRVAAFHPECIFLKLGLAVDKEYEKQNGDKEHMWFMMKCFVGPDMFEARLLNEPYYIKQLHKGDINVYMTSEITDWYIRVQDYIITPDNVYLLDYLFVDGN